MLRLFLFIILGLNIGALAAPGPELTAGNTLQVTSVVRDGDTISLHYNLANTMGGSSEYTFSGELNSVDNSIETVFGSVPVDYLSNPYQMNFYLGLHTGQYMGNSDPLQFLPYSDLANDQISEILSSIPR